jgi:hypothetical protein
MKISQNQFLKAVQIVQDYKNEVCKLAKIAESVYTKETLIRDAEISVRLWNIILDDRETTSNVTIEDLAAIPISAYRRKRNFGKKSELELMELFSTVGIKWKR